MHKSTAGKSLIHLCGILIVGLTILCVVGFAQRGLWALGHRAALQSTRRVIYGHQEPTEAQRFAWAPKRVTTDGRIHIILESKTYLKEQLRSLEIRDGDGEVIWTGQAKDIPYRYLQWAGGSARRHYDAGGQSWHGDRRSVIYGVIETLIVPVAEAVAGERRVTQHWVYQPGRQVFAGYDEQEQPIGYLGAGGVAESAEEAEPFGAILYVAAWCPEEVLTPTLLWKTERGGFQIDFENLHVDPLWRSTEDGLTQVHWTPWWVSNAPGSDPFVHVKLNDTTHQLRMRNPDRELTIHTPERMSSGNVWFARDGDRIFLKFYSSDALIRSRSRTYASRIREWRKLKPGSYQTWIEIYEVKPDGALDAMSRFEWTQHWTARSGRLRSAEDFLIALDVGLRSLSPPPYAWLDRWFDSTGVKSQTPRSNLHGIARTIAAQAPLRGPLNWLIALAAGAVAFWHGLKRRTSWLGLAGWVLLAVAFNIAGLLTYLALNHTAVIRCPACGLRRGLNQPACRACGAPLPQAEPAVADQSLLPAT